MTELDRTAQTIGLHDGRTLAFAEYGDLSGTPVFYFTGGNSSRLEGAWFDDVARRRGVRLIATDRPGFGLSSYQPGRTFLDWPADIAQLADTLNVSTFAVVGLSGGGPHVAAFAYMMQERLSAAAIVSGPCPYGSPHMFDGMWLPIRLMYFVARHAPSWLNEKVQSAMSNPDMLIENIDRLPKPDAALLRDAPHLAELFRLSQIESLRNGARGAAHEWRLYTRPWGFALEDVSMRIQLWYGEEDVNAPPAMGRHLAARFPNGQMTLLPNEAHFSLIHNHIDDILTDLLT